MIFSAALFCKNSFRAEVQRAIKQRRVEEQAKLVRGAKAKKRHVKRKGDDGGREVVKVKAHLGGETYDLEVHHSGRLLKQNTTKTRL